MNLSDKKAQLIKQLDQVELLEKCIKTNNLTLHVNSSVFDIYNEMMVTLSTGEQLKVTDKMIVKIRLNDVDTFIDYTDYISFNSEQLKIVHLKLEHFESEKFWNMEHENTDCTNEINIFIADLIKGNKNTSLVDDLSIAQSLTIDGDSIRIFNICENGDDDDVYLDASQFQFTKAQIESAIKENLVWTITDEGSEEEYELTCEKVAAF